MENEYDMEMGYGVNSDVNLEENCVICLQPITNPMCAECYLKHVDEWLRSRGMMAIESQIVVDHVRDRLPANNPNRDVCIVCKKNHLSVCSYCFVFLASKSLRDLNFGTVFEEEFENMFSYRC